MVTHVFAGIPVADFDTACHWYEIFAGRRPDLAPKPGDAAWELAGGGWISVVADADRAGSALVTLLVDDLERQVGFLAMRGIAPESIETVPGVARRATFHDPAGNTITVAQSLVADKPGADGG